MVAQKPSELRRAARIGLAQQHDCLAIDHTEGAVFDRTIARPHSVRFDETLSVRLGRRSAQALRGAPDWQIGWLGGVKQWLSGQRHVGPSIGDPGLQGFLHYRLAGKVDHAERLSRGGRGADESGGESGEGKGSGAGHASGIAAPTCEAPNACP